jgi:hypothetical protein
VIQITSANKEGGFELESHLLGENFDFQIIAYIFPKYAVINEADVYPTETKITIVTEDFPFQEEESKLALLISATSETEIEAEKMNGEDDVEIESENATGYFSWSDVAYVDGTETPVNSIITETEDGSLIALSYSRGTEIMHDPKLGVSLLSVLAGFPWIYFIAGAAIIAVVVAVVIRISRPRIQNSIHP